MFVDAAAVADADRSQERRATEDLAHYLELMSGARPDIADTPETAAAALDGDTPVFIIGELALRTRPGLDNRLRDVVTAHPFVIVQRSSDGVERADGVASLDEVAFEGVNSLMDCLENKNDRPRQIVLRSVVEGIA